MFDIANLVVPTGAVSEDFVATAELGSTRVIALADGAGGVSGGARAGELGEAAQSLVDAVRLRSGALQDDVAVVLCRHQPPGAVGAR